MGRDDMVRRRFTGGLIAIAMAAASLAIPAANANEVEALASPLDLTAPAAPAPISMGCADGQVDLNHADLALLQTLPTPSGGGTLSAPVARSIMEGRPYLQPHDLRAPAVKGVTDNHVDRWQADDLVCVTPIFTEAADGTQAPVAPNVCTDGQDDINDADSQSRFADLFGRPTGARLVEGQPYPSVVNALRSAGVGPGQIKKYSEHLCATPYPILFEGVNWAFATRRDGIATTTTGGFGDYTLIVPEGVVTGDGAWTSVHEVDAPANAMIGITDYDLNLPAVDAHIHGYWDGQVGLALPPDSIDVGDGNDDAWGYAVIHLSDVSGLTMHGGSAVATADDGRLVTALTDLSISFDIRLPLKWIADGVVNLVQHAEQVLRAVLGVGSPNLQCSPDLTGQTLPGGEVFTVGSDMFGYNIGNLTPRVQHCVTRHDSTDEIDVKFGNNRGVVMPVLPHPTVDMHDLDNYGNPLWWLSNSAFNQVTDVRLLAPGSAITGRLDGVYSGHFNFATSPGDVFYPTFLYWVTEEVGGAIPIPDRLINLLYPLSSCTSKILTRAYSSVTGDAQAAAAFWANVSDAFQCSLSELDTLIDGDEMSFVQRWIGNPTVGHVEDWGVIREAIQRINWVMIIAKYSVVTVDMFDVVGTNGRVDMSWRPPAPDGPDEDASGRAIYEDCVTKTFSYDTGWTVTVDEICQDLHHGTYNGGTTPPDGDPAEPAVDAFADKDGSITQLRMYNLLRRDANGVLSLILLEGGQLIAHPISPGDEWDFKQDWPEDEWRSAEFTGLVDGYGPQAVNDPLLLRNYLNGDGGNWLLRQPDGFAWYIDGDGIRHPLGHDASAQQAISNKNLTLDPAQYANDICPYRTPGQTGIIVC